MSSECIHILRRYIANRQGLYTLISIGVSSCQHSNIFLTRSLSYRITQPPGGALGIGEGNLRMSTFGGVVRRGRAFLGRDSQYYVGKL